MKIKLSHRKAFLLAAVFALAACFSASRTLNAYLKITPIVVSKTKMQRGHVISAADITTNMVPKSSVPAGAFIDPSKCMGLAAAGLIPPGEVLTPDVLIPASAAGEASIIARDYPGLEAYAVPSGIDTTVGGLAEPGDRVELSALIKANGTARSSVSVVAPNAVVLYLSQQNSGGNSGSVVLGLTPAESIQAKNFEAAGATFKAVLLPSER